MYQSFYGLKQNPFNVTPDPEFLYLGQKHREALAHLVYGVREKKGFIVITGEVGTGKTTLIRCLLERLHNGNGTKAAFLFNPKLEATEFIQYILKDLGLTIQGATKGDSLHTLNEYLLAAYEKGERVILIVDEAQALDPNVLEEIRLLSNLETSKAKLLQIILAGQPELDQTLSRSEFRQIRQRINMRYHLKALSEEETKEYIQKRLQGVSGARAARDGICPVPSADGRTPSDDGANAQSFGGSKWWKWKKSHEGNAYRAVYSVRYADAVYVLHALLA